MFRLWARTFKDNHMLKDTVICDDSPDTRTHKVFHALEAVCYEFDLGRPIWLDSNIAASPGLLLSGMDYGRQLYIAWYKAQSTNHSKQ